jgi:hypothetical protein
MLPSGETVVVACSGGPDSICLLHALHRLRRLFGIRLAVFHFDHRLRPGSDRDAAYVARRAERLGIPKIATGDIPSATGYLQESYSLFATRGYQLGMACCLAGLACVLVELGSSEPAVRILGAVQSGLESIEMALAPADRLAADEFTDIARGQLGDRAFTIAWEAGSSLSLPEAAELAAEAISRE